MGLYNKQIISPQKIRKMRKDLGLTQQQCANMIKKHLVSWQFYEYGKSNMPATVLELFLLKVDEVKKFDHSNTVFMHKLTGVVDSYENFINSGCGLSELKVIHIIV